MQANRRVVRYGSEIPADIVRKVIDRGYAPDLGDAEFAKLRADPFLVAHALADAGGIVVVTMEVSKPACERANRHLPDVCDALGVPCINTFELLRHLNFTTDWRARQR